MQQIRRFLKLSQPLFLLETALLYVLGAGIARYLGALIDGAQFALGLGWVLALLLSAIYLNAYFADQDASDKHSKSDQYEDTEQRFSKEIPLWFGITALTITTSFSLILLRRGAIDGAVYLVMGFMLLGAFVSAVPPFRLAGGESKGLLLSIVMPIFVPALSFMLQGEVLHRLVSMSTFPLILLHFAMMLILEFPSYAADLRKSSPSLLIRLGWQSGMRLIDILILSAYLLLGIAMLIGMPLSIAMPAFLTLPLALLMIWYLGRIGAGAKPHWKALNLMAILVFGLTVYLLAFSFWTH